MITIIYWTVTACYTALIVSLWFLVMIEYPESKIGSQTWHRINITIGVVWVVLILLSTLVTSFSIFKIFHTMNQLQSINLNVKISKWTFSLHLALLTLQTINVIFFFANDFKQTDKVFYVDYFSLPVVDFLMQLAICFICFSLGAHRNLNRHIMSFEVDERGAARIVFNTQESLQQSLDQFLSS